MVKGNKVWIRACGCEAQFKFGGCHDAGRNRKRKRKGSLGETAEKLNWRRGFGLKRGRKEQET